MVQLRPLSGKKCPKISVQISWMQKTTTGGEKGEEQLRFLFSLGLEVKLKDSLVS